MKFRSNITIDEDLHAEAIDRGINISNAAEDAIREKLDKVPVNADKCKYCGKIERKATKENLKGLTWLWPDEVWICDSCLKNEMRKVPVSR